MIPPRRIFILISGTRNIIEKSKKKKYSNYDSYLLFRPRNRTKKKFRWVFPKLNNFSFFRLMKLILSEEQLLSLDFVESLHPLIEIK